MNSLTKSLIFGSLALLAVASSFAADSDPGYSNTVPLKGVNGRSGNRYAPQYLRPTQRFYGKGYTVAYRFIPWSDRMRSLNASSMWDSDQMRLPADAAATTSVTGNSPRVTYFYKKPSASTGKGMLPDHSAIVGAPKPLPPIAEGPANTEAAPKP
jgi:hypothetical protein